MLELQTLRQQNQLLLCQLRQRQADYKSLTKCSTSGSVNSNTTQKSYVHENPSVTSRSINLNGYHFRVPDNSANIKESSTTCTSVLPGGQNSVSNDHTDENETHVKQLYSLTPRKHLASKAKSSIADCAVRTGNNVEFVDKSLMGTDTMADYNHDNLGTIPIYFDSSNNPANDKHVTCDTFNSQSSSNKTMTSTPVKATHSQSGTPRSILKRRKIIDDNIHVESRYPHTPSLKSPKRMNLNFSYSHVDEDLDAQRLHHLQTQGTVDSDLDGSYLEEITSKASSHAGERTLEDERRQHDLMSGQIEELLQKRLLLDTGNDRENASIVEDLNKRPVSVAFQSKGPESILNNSQKKKVHKLDKSVRFMDEVSHGPQTAEPVQTTMPPSGKEPEKTQNTSLSKLWQSRSEHPLLGYDWIAGLLDNETSVADKSEDYFNELNEFRRVCKDECYGKYLFDQKFDLDRPISPEVKDPGHTCIHGYTINERLFTEPINSDEDGNSLCPICLTTRKEPTQQSPGFVRVSIPHSTMQSPYRIKPHRRRSFDPTDSYALAKHCLAGYETSRPAMLPTAKTVDLKNSVNGVKTKNSTTMEGAVKEAQSFSSRAKSSMTAGQTTQDLLNTTLSRTTDDLLNASHSLRYDLQLLEKNRGLARNNPPASTAYPLL